MSIKINQLKVGVVLSYVTTALNMIVHLLYTPIMIQLLGQSEYGLYTLVGSFVSYLSLFSLGFTSAYLRFYSRYESKKDYIGVANLNGMFLLIFSLMSLAALICGMVLSCFTQQIFGANLTPYELQKAEILMRILVVNIALTFPSSLLTSMISAHEQFFFQRLVNLLAVIFNPLICLPLLFLGYDSVAVVLVTTTISFLKLVVNFSFCKKRLKVQFDFKRMDISILREISVFSVFIFLNMIIDQINWSVDKFVLGRVSGTIAVAIYGVGAQINSIYKQFSTSISSVFAPRVNKIVAENKENMYQEITELFTKVGRIQGLILLLIVTGFVFFGKYFITDIYTSEQYLESYYVALLLMIPITIPAMQNIGIEIQRAMNKHRVRSIVYFFVAIGNVLISIPLSKTFGPIGAAMGTTVGLVIGNIIFMNLYYHKAIGINILYFWKSILSLCKGLILPGILGCIINSYITFHNIVEFVGWVIIYSCVYMVSMWRFGMNTYEKELALNQIRRLLRGKNDKNK